MNDFIQNITKNAQKSFCREINDIIKHFAPFHEKHYKLFLEMNKAAFAGGSQSNQIQPLKYSFDNVHFEFIDVDKCLIRVFSQNESLVANQIDWSYFEIAYTCNHGIYVVCVSYNGIEIVKFTISLLEGTNHYEYDILAAKNTFNRMTILLTHILQKRIKPIIEGCLTQI